MSGYLTCFENLAYSAYFWQTGKPNFSGPSNNSLSCSGVKPSIHKSAYTQLPWAPTL